MADLEDFFAKRDKKKKSKGKKYDTVDIDDVAKVLDAKAKERKKLEVYQPEPPAADQQATTQQAANEDDEWKELADDTPDFSGLKIQEFVLEDEENANSKEEGNGDGNAPKQVWKVYKPEPKELEPEKSESPEPSSQDKLDKAPPSEESTKIETAEPSASGPGKYVTPAQRRKMEEEKQKEQSKPPVSVGVDSRPKPLATAPGGKYVPPGMRAGASAPTGGLPSKPKRQGAAPKIDSEELFPSLGGS